MALWQHPVHLMEVAVLAPGPCHHEETREHELVGMQQEQACASSLFTGSSCWLSIIKWSHSFLELLPTDVGVT